MRVVGIRALALLGVCLLWAASGAARADDATTAPADPASPGPATAPAEPATSPAEPATVPEDSVSQDPNSESVTPGDGSASDVAAWRDPVVLRAHLEAAIVAVEAATGVRFGLPPCVRLSAEEDVRRLLAGLAEGDQGVLEYAPDAQRRLLAYYDPTEFVVHVLPDEFRAVAAELSAPDLLSTDMLRIILVHEVAHALDFQHFPVQWTLACCAATDERLATEAILEGHAQLVTEEVARQWGIEHAFRRLTQLYTGAADPNTLALVGDAPDQDAAFTYLQGYEFMKTIRRARGRAGIDAVLRDPPYETRVIDRPELWLYPEQRGREHDLQAFLELFRTLVPGGEWDVGKWRILGPAGLTPNTALAPGAESYLDNHGLYVGSPDGNRYLNVFVAQCTSAEDAEGFVRALRTVDETRDRAPEWQPALRREGAGPEGKLTGFRSKRRAVGDDPDSELTMHVLREGPYVLEMSTYGLAHTDANARSSAVDLAARLLRAPAPGSAAVALRGHLLDFIGARAAGQTEAARVLLRDLLPSAADLRRVIRPVIAGQYAASYTGPRLALRNTRVPDATLHSAFAECGAGTEVITCAATTEELVAGGGCANLFPPEMRAFARDVARPGVTWLVLELKPPGSDEATRYACFARLADRFLFVKNPWAVLE